MVWRMMKQDTYNVILLLYCGNNFEKTHNVHNPTTLVRTHVYHLVVGRSV